MRETKVLLNICRSRSGCNCCEHPKWQVYSTPGSFVRQQGTPRITLMHILHTRSLYCVCQQLQDWQCTRLLKEEHDKYTRIPLAFGGISVTCSYSMKFWLKKCCWRSKYLEHMWVSLCVNIFVWHLDWHAKAVLDVPDHLRAVAGGVLCESTAAAVIFGLVCDALAAWFLLDCYAAVHV